MWAEACLASVASSWVMWGLGWALRRAWRKGNKVFLAKKKKKKFFLKKRKVLLLKFGTLHMLLKGAMFFKLALDCTVIKEKYRFSPFLFQFVRDV